MKVWMLKEDPSSERYACRPDSTEPGFGDICAYRFMPPTPSNWRNYDWYILNSKEQAEWYKAGIEERMKEALRKDDPDFIPHVQIVEVDITFNGFSDVELKNVDKPAEPKPEHPPVSERLSKRQEEAVEKNLDIAISLLTDLGMLAHFRETPSVEVLANRIQEHMFAIKHIMFPEPEEYDI